MGCHSVFSQGLKHDAGKRLRGTSSITRCLDSKRYAGPGQRSPFRSRPRAAVLNGLPHPGRGSEQPALPIIEQNCPSDVSNALVLDDTSEKSTSSGKKKKKKPETTFPRFYSRISLRPATLEKYTQF